MGWDIVPIAKHNLNISNIEDLAKDLFKRLNVNIKYGFYILDEHQQFFENSFSKGFNQLGNFEKDKNYTTFTLIDENYIDKLLLKKYGKSIFYNTKYWDRPYSKDKLPDEKYIKETIANLQYNWYLFECDNEDEYQFMNIYNHCYTNSIPYYTRWSGLCRFFDSKRYQIKADRDYFFEFRKTLMDFAFKLGSDKIYYINDQNHDVFEGVGSSNEASMTWEVVESFIIKKTKHLMVNIPKFFAEEIYKKEFHLKKEYTLSFVDDFSDLKL